MQLHSRAIPLVFAGSNPASLRDIIPLVHLFPFIRWLLHVFIPDLMYSSHVPLHAYWMPRLVLTACYPARIDEFTPLVSLLPIIRNIYLDPTLSVLCLFMRCESLVLNSQPPIPPALMI